MDNTNIMVERADKKYRARFITIPFGETFSLPRLSEILNSKFHEGGGCDLLILEWSEWIDENGDYVWSHNE